MTRRLLLTLLAASALLSACGFQLRGSATLPYDTIYLQVPLGSPLATLFKRTVGPGGNTRFVNDAKSAAVTIEVTRELREKVILSLSGGGRVNEFQLRYRLFYRIKDKDLKDVLPPEEISLTRDLTYTDTEALGKEQEEAMLYRDMQGDAVRQMVRRLQIAKPDVSKAGRPAP